MVNSCAAYKCTSRYKKDNGISFYSFPKDPEIREKWVIATKRENFTPSPHSKLCSKHFTKEQYQLRPNCNLELLRSDAIPTLFDFPSHLTKSPPKKRRTVIKMTDTGPCKEYSDEEGAMKRALELIKCGESFSEVSKHTGISLDVLHRHFGDVDRPRKRYERRKKGRKGLTKIRIEDCLRCDECSCIYIDPMDYDKHMRNHHQKFFTVRSRSPSPQEEETIRTMRYEKSKKLKALDTTFIVESNMVHSMKSRWSKVLSERLSSAKRPCLEHEESLDTPVMKHEESLDTPLLEHEESLDTPVFDPHIVIKSEPEGESIFDPNVQVKEEPADDDNILDLLSQVEVKIKTEPPDGHESF